MIASLIARVSRAVRGATFFSLKAFHSPLCLSLALPKQKTHVQEWDEPERGKHDGTVVAKDGTRDVYFKTAHPTVQWVARALPTTVFLFIQREGPLPRDAPRKLRARSLPLCMCVYLDFYQSTIMCV